MRRYFAALAVLVISACSGSSEATRSDALQSARSNAVPPVVDGLQAQLAPGWVPIVDPYAVRPRGPAIAGYVTSDAVAPPGNDPRNAAKGLVQYTEVRRDPDEASPVVGYMLNALGFVRLDDLHSLFADPDGYARTRIPSGVVPSAEYEATVVRAVTAAEALKAAH